MGAKFYGAFWCSHCYDQKVQFGAQAAELLPYVECFPDGYRCVRALHRHALMHSRRGLVCHATGASHLRPTNVFLTCRLSQPTLKNSPNFSRWRESSTHGRARGRVTLYWNSVWVSWGLPASIEEHCLVISPPPKTQQRGYSLPTACHLSLSITYHLVLSHRPFCCLALRESD